MASAAILLALIAVAAVAFWPKVLAFLEARVRRDIEAGPLLVRDAAGEAVLATLLSYEEPRWSRSRAGRGTRQIVELQLNRMSDAADLGSVALMRTTQSGNLNVYLLGAEADRVWIFADGLRAVSVSRREVEIDPATIEARVPKLKGQLPDDRKFYEVDEGGLKLTARDGTRYLLDTRTWNLGPQPEPTSTPAAQDWTRRLQEWSARMDESTATTFAQQPGEYGLDSWRDGERWLGLLSDAERQNYSQRWDRPSRQNNVDPQRRKIWTAPARTREDGESELGEMRALTEKAYLRGGFLRHGRKLRPVQPKDSPDLLVEHYSAIDDSAQVLLTRVTPAGEERWTATLPLKLPNTIHATDEYVAFRGLPPGTAFIHRAQLVCVKLSDGSFSTFSFN